ncbi:MAG: hypothetical protein HOV81_38590 [Kofleriaceae bacterium]|nr:hypothetical protein [Kofleriaceae bacterium]
MIEVGGLADDQRALLAALWQSRADSESSVRVVFDQLVAELVATGARTEVVALARRAAEDEVRHARICVELAAAYRGEPAAVTPAPAVRLPDYVADARLRAALHALNLCCIGETIATGFVEACVAACAGGELEDIHRRHFADEIHHARVGWAHIASLSREDRAALAPFIEAILRAQVTAWESRIAELPEHGVPGHGYPPRAELVAAIYAAVRDVVLPGFAHVGVDASTAAAWFETHARTHVP